jgi:hypothetical protein
VTGRWREWKRAAGSLAWMLTVPTHDGVCTHGGHAAICSAPYAQNTMQMRAGEGIKALGRLPYRKSTNSEANLPAPMLWHKVLHQ